MNLLIILLLKARDFFNIYFTKLYQIDKKKRYDIDKSVKFHLNTFIFGKGKIIIGRNTYFGRETFVVSEPESAKIEIGENCKISHSVHIRTASYSTQINRIIKFSDIRIGNNVWIGANVFIRGGVKIGDNVSIGANSVVTKSFPSNVVIGGIPAVIVKTINEE